MFYWLKLLFWLDEDDAVVGVGLRAVDALSVGVVVHCFVWLVVLVAALVVADV